MSDKFKISFGILAPSLAEQLTKERFSFDAGKMDHLETTRQCLLACLFAKVITNGESKKAFGRLFKQIIKEITDLENK
jgi:hypothetical protein